MVAWGSSGFSSFQTDPVMNVQGTPFWNNWSTDTGTGGSHDMNIGYMLSDTGGFAGTPGVLGTDGVAEALLGPSGSDPTSFTFTETGNSYTTQVLGAYSNMNIQNDDSAGTVFGWYYIDPNTQQPVLLPLYSALGFATTPGAVTDFSHGLPSGVTQYGFFATVCYGATCNAQDQETFFTDSSLNTGVLGASAVGVNHFALFSLNSSATNNYVIGFKDGPVTTEGLGDFNDIVVEVADPFDFPPPTDTPEPATMSTIGFGLLVLGFAGRRFTR